MKSGIRLAVRVTPNASRNELDGVVVGSDGRPMLQLRLTAPPVDGAANTALIEFLAAELKMRRSAIRIFSGETARLKRLELEGEPSAIAERLIEWMSRAGHRPR